jgi:hypothetical protein
VAVRVLVGGLECWREGRTLPTSGVRDLEEGEEERESVGWEVLVYLQGNGQGPEGSTATRAVSTDKGEEGGGLEQRTFQTQLLLSTALLVTLTALILPPTTLPNPRATLSLISSPLPPSTPHPSPLHHSSAPICWQSQPYWV